jgi:hypothetical protein
MVSPDDELGPADQDRLNAIADQYDQPASKEEIIRHLADIAREREVRRAKPPEL